MTDLLDTSKAIVGVAGSGKTVTAKDDVRQLLEQRRHVAIVDPTGVWWGMRASPDGTGVGFELPIFGGDHGDVPIGPKTGAAVARLIVEQRVSAIVDLSAIDNSRDWRRFMADFVAELRKKPKGNFHLVVDEADEFAAERPADDVGFALRENLVWVAKRGRVQGFVPTFITQRTAEIAKAVISQAQTIIAHQLIAPSDQKAIDDYLKGHGSVDVRREVMASLAELAVGERWIYSPRLKLLERGFTPPPSTYDSSRTPAAGEQVVEPRTLAQLDVSAIAAAIAPANEPEGQKSVYPDDTIPADAEAAYRKGSVVGTMLRERDERIVDLEAANALLKAMAEELASERDQLADDIGELDRQLDGYEVALTAIEEIIAECRRGKLRSPRATQISAAGERTPRPRVEDVPSTAAPVDSAAAGGASTLGPERKPLAVLVGYHPAGLSDAAWATLATFKRTGGTWSTYRSRLRSAGLIEQGTDKLWRATAAGVAAIGAAFTRPPTPGPGLVDFWAAHVPGAGRMLRQLGQQYPNALTRRQLAAILGMSESGGTFGTYLGRLRGNGLIEEKDKRIRVAPALMGDL